MEDENNDILEEVEDEEELDSVDGDEHSPQEKKLYAQMKSEREKRQALQKEVDELKAPKPVEATVEKPAEKSEVPTDFERILEVTKVTRDLSSEELEELTLKAKELGVKADSLVTNHVWTSHLKEFRAEHENKAKIPSPSKRSASARKKEYGNVMASEEASPAEKQAAFEAKRDEALGK